MHLFHTFAKFTNCRWQFRELWWLTRRRLPQIRPKFNERQLTCGVPNRSKKLEFEVETRVSDDVILFRYENDRLFKILNIFALSQFIFWTYLAHFCYTTLRDVTKEEAEKQMMATLKAQGKEDAPGLVWWRRVNLGENKYRYGISIMCLSIGYIIMVGATLYTRRTVKYLTLLKGGKAVKLTCYSPFLRPYSFAVPLDHLTCNVARSPNNHLPLKVKNRWMYFLMDKSGTYTNTKLFDYTAGVKRIWSK